MRRNFIILYLLKNIDLFFELDDYYPYLQMEHLMHNINTICNLMTKYLILMNMIYYSKFPGLYKMEYLPRFLSDYYELFLIYLNLLF